MTDDIKSAVEAAKQVIADPMSASNRIVRKIALSLVNLASRVEKIEADAERWRALMSSQRIRHMGSSGFRWDGGTPIPVRDDGYMHMGIEFWSQHEAAHPSAEYPQEKSRALLEAYVDRIRNLSQPKE